MGFVYIVEFTKQDCVKIGMTNDVDPFKRINSFKTYAPYGIKTLALIETKNASFLESVLHKKYKSKRIETNREFFKLSKEDIEEIKTNFENNDEDLIILLKELKELFSSVFDLKVFLKNELEKGRSKGFFENKNFTKDSEKVKDFLIKNHKGEFLPAKVIFEIINNSYLNLSNKYNLNNFGAKILRSNFKRTGARYKGLSVKGYIIE